MRRRKAKRRYTWFPVVGAAGPAENDNFAQLIGSFTVTPFGVTDTTISPLVPDVPMEGDAINVNAPGQLVQALGQEYYVERIVGKCFLAHSAPLDDLPTTAFNKTALIGCGIFVARANDEDVGGGPNTPIGSATPAERNENYGVLGEDTIREPWLWRRTWILNTGRTANNGAPGPFLPQFETINGQIVYTGGGVPNNLVHGSALDGPHFDAKSVRRVGNDERLWFAISVRSLDAILNVPGGSNNVSTVSLVLDYRVLGRLTRPHNRSTF